MTVTDFDDFVLWVTLGIILGGRIGYVLFYNLPHFVRIPPRSSSFGMAACHSTGDSPAACAVLLFGYRRGIPVLSLGDITCAVGTDRIVPRPHRQFHQRRIVGPAPTCPGR